MSKLIKTRFAPSPTGFMHVGNFRTALYAYLFAKHNQGKFILRIEDTDQNREVADAEQAIFRVLKWAGLEHDEGPDIGGPCGPYRQSDRLEIYQKYSQKLIETGQAYYCFCDQDRLEQLRKKQQTQGLPTKYDRHCLNLSNQEINQKIKSGQKYVIRQKINSSGVTVFKDLVLGTIKIENSTLDDSVLIKSDGWPTYNFANVIDDHLMKITHITRGNEYITSTPKYIQLYQAFGWPVPEHAHFPLILNQDKSKLSKRQGDVAMEDYINKGYLPETMINFIALLGWNPGNDQEIFSLEELIKIFDLSKVNKSGAVFDIEKLNWMNSHYIKQKNLDELTELCLPYLKKNYPSQTASCQPKFVKLIVDLEQERIKTLSEIGDRVSYFFKTPIYSPEKLIWKKSNRQTTINRLQFVLEFIQLIPSQNWTRNTLEQSLLEQIKQKNLDNGTTLWPLRVALSGQEKSPTPFEIAEILGKKETIERIKQSIKKLQSK